jgi:hypothetical protein
MTTRLEILIYGLNFSHLENLELYVILQFMFKGIKVGSLGKTVEYVKAREPRECNRQ